MIKSVIKKLIDKIIVYVLREFEERLTKNIKFELARGSLVESASYVRSRMYNIPSVDSKWKVHDIAFSCAKCDGLILEFGVYRGETINYLAAKSEKIIHGFDSFEGLPEYWRDGFSKGEFALDALPGVKENVKLHKGWFDETIPRFIKENNFSAISYLHIDCDLYSSTKTIFEELRSYIKPGTVIVFDEYFNYPGWELGEVKAFKEFTVQNSINYEYLVYNYKDEQVAVIIRE